MNCFLERHFGDTCQCHFVMARARAVGDTGAEGNLKVWWGLTTFIAPSLAELAKKHDKTQLVA